MFTCGQLQSSSFLPLYHHLHLDLTGLQSRAWFFIRNTYYQFRPRLNSHLLVWQALTGTLFSYTSSYRWWPPHPSLPLSQTLICIFTTFLEGGSVLLDGWQDVTLPSQWAMSQVFASCGLPRVIIKPRTKQMIWSQPSWEAFTRWTRW